MVIGTLKFSISTRPGMGHGGETAIVWTISELALESSIETGVILEEVYQWHEEISKRS